jgi:hypothetical protein
MIAPIIKPFNAKQEIMSTTENTTAGNFLWNGPSLLVPVDVEALVVSKLAQNLQWSYNRMKYNNAGKFENVRPSMFAGADKPGVGVTLHWALPDGITHGLQASEGTEISYPYAPNRWLVIRYYDGKSKAWVLQSDHLDPKTGINLFLQPDAATPTQTRIGKVWPAEQWPGEAGVKQQRFLMALGPGNPAFAAFTANINGVFSFYDDMSDILDQAIPVTYSVMGWYARAEDDPLFTFSDLKSWLELMNQMEWTVGDNNDLQRAVNDWTAWAKVNNITVDPADPKDIYPSRTLCQGMVYKVNWLGQNGTVQSGVPQYDPSMPADLQPRIAIANTSIDALAALVEYELNLKGQGGGEGAAELLEAFNYNLLNKYEQQGGQYELYREVFKAWFGNYDGEEYYYIEDKDKPTAPFIDPARLDNLVLLNQKLELHNINHYLIKAAQADMYGNWWKSGKADTLWGKPPAGITKAQWDKIQQDLRTAIPKDKAAASKLQDDNKKLADEIVQLKGKVTEGLPSTQELKLNTGNRYHQANEPVVLVYGAHRAYRHGEDGRFEEDEVLFTRFTGQTITGLDVMIPRQKAQLVTAANVTMPPLNLPFALLPKEVSSLSVETYFFDTLNAEAIAKAACTLLGIPFDPVYTAVVEAQQTAAWNADVYDIDRQLVTDAAGFTGTIPSRIAVQLWLAPWAPLYMAWEIKWIPSYVNPADALKQWIFDPEALEYRWDTQYNISGSGVTISGSSLLTPNSAFVMGAQLEKYFEDTGKFPDLKDFLNTVSNWDFLTQSMSGLNELLLALNPNQLNQPPADINQLAGDMTQLSPVPDLTPVPVTPDGSVGYYPIRAGHFQLSRLWIVDDFGQVFDPISAVGQSAASYHPVLGTGMITPGNPNLVQLPPRITQGARFDFNFAAGDGKTNQTGQQNQLMNPLCGWMLPNHLDKGLSLYTPDGFLLGELLLTGNDKAMKLRWDNAPGKNIPVGAPLEDIIANDYMRAFVTQLLQREDNAKAFIDLLAIIDETLWTVEPLGGRNNELISVFIGRPLALVRSRMEYRFMGSPVYSQSWLNSTLQNTGGFNKVKFPVQVGCLQNPQDGTIGYFNSDFRTFNSILSQQIPVSSGYVTADPVSISFDDGAKDIFMIVDPRGDVNAISGILPVQVNVLPGNLVEDAMANMNVTFRTGPLITDPDKLSMPLPSEMSGKWSWIQHTGVTTWEEISQIAQANAKARLGTDYELKDGWLKLSNALTENK